MSDANAALNQEPATTPTPPNPAPKRDLSLLAAEYFGDEYHGAKPEKPKAPEPELETAITEAVAESTDDGDDETEAELDVAELIQQHIDSDPTLLSKIRLRLKVDGELSDETLEAVKSERQMDRAANKRLEDAKAKAAEIIAESTAKANKIGERFAEAVGLIESLESDLGDDIKAADMDKLRREDPAEWAAKNAEFDKRRAKIGARKQAAAEKYQKANLQHQEEQKATFDKFFAAEQAALFEKRPEWRDKDTFKAEGTKMQEFLSTYRPNTAQQVVHNHELFLMAEEARLYRESKANTNAALKKLEKVPRTLKPGTPTPPETSQKRNLDKLRSTLRKSGSVDDAVALLRARRSK